VETTTSSDAAGALWRDTGIATKVHTPGASCHDRHWPARRSAIKARRRHEETEIAHMRAVTRQAAAAQHGVTTTAVPHGSGGDNGAVAWGAAMQRLAAPGHNQAMAKLEAASVGHTQ